MLYHSILSNKARFMR